ncbi:MAG: hypothetical protein ABIR24_00395 [Verrucomicrobiota bacterium]
MKKFSKWCLCLAVALSGASIQLQAAQTERLLTFALTGFRQDEDALGNPKAIPFRASTRDVLEEIELATGASVTNGILLMVESLDDTNAPIQIVARKGTSDFIVTDLFTFTYGEAVSTDLGTRGTFYAIDQIEFSTLNVDTNGLTLQFQGFTKETQATVTKRLGTTPVEFVTKTFNTIGNGELRFIDSFFGPVKGTVKLGAPKLVPSPATF